MKIFISKFFGLVYDVPSKLIFNTLIPRPKAAMPSHDSMTLNYFTIWKSPHSIQLKL